MKKFLSTVIAIFIFMISTNVFANEYPTCIFLRFANDTRYKNIDSPELLSDLVMEKLLATGKFNLQETQPLDSKIETELYDETVRDLAYTTNLRRNSNLSQLFEGPGFDELQAQSIATAALGQFIQPKITSAIGNAHGAEYIIQGTVINMGDGVWNDLNSGLYTQGAQILLSQVLSSSVGFAGLGIERKEAGIGIQADLKIIKAATGEVIWRKLITGMKKTALTKVSLGILPIPLKFGTAKLSSDMYNKAMEDAAQKIVDALLIDLEAGKLFVK